MIATSAPLTDVLDRLAQLIESQLDGVSASILLLDEAGLRLHHGAAPSLPAAYAEAVDGLRIGPGAGSCGTAAFTREAVIVADVMRDARWTEYRALAPSTASDPAGRRRSFRIRSRCSARSRFIRARCDAPSAAELRLIDAATKIAGIAIERKLAEDRIQFMATHDALTGLPNRALLEGAPHAGDPARAAPRSLGDGRLRRSRQFQVRQRQPRPQRRRRTAQVDRRTDGRAPCARPTPSCASAATSSS